MALQLTVVLGIGALVFPVSVGAHDWSNNCTSGPGLLSVREDQNNNGAEDRSCDDDDEWGNSQGDIRNFHDKMTAYHLRDDDFTNNVCVKFWFDPFWLGTYNFRQGTTGHLIEDNVGSANNDKVDSHKMDNSAC